MFEEPEGGWQRACAAAVGQDPVASWDFNPGQRRFFKLIENPCPSLTVVEFLKGNGSGGSWALVAAWSAIMWGTASPFFKAAPFGPKRWPFKRQIRLVTTTESLKDSGPIQTAMKMLFPVGRWHQSRGLGRAFYSQGYTDTGFVWDIMTYNQSVEEFAAANKGCILLSEPSPEAIFFEVCTRLRGHGLVLVDMTQLDMAQYNQKLLDDGLTISGKKIGEVRHTYMHHHEACAEHYEGGHRKHTEIEADYALWLRQDPGVAEARASGKSLRLSGRIYSTWGEANEIEKLSDYHQECWDNDRVVISSVIDPHDRKPWAMCWFATFPNSDVIGFAEWPPMLFHEMKSSPINDIEDYRALIIDTETEIGHEVINRRIDPEFGEAPKAGKGKSVKTMLSMPCRICLADYGDDEAIEKCKHRLLYTGAPNAIPTGHALVRTAIGNPAKGVRPKFYAIKSACPNLCYGIRHYAYKEETNPLKALSERPQLVFKDFPDLPRYLFNAGLNAWFGEDEEAPQQGIRTRTSAYKHRR